jgi:hypothetical protein
MKPFIIESNKKSVIRIYIGAISMSIKSIDLNGLVKNITSTIPDPSIHQSINQYFYSKTNAILNVFYS